MCWGVLCAVHAAGQGAGCEYVLARAGGGMGLPQLLRLLQPPEHAGGEVHDPWLVLHFGPPPPAEGAAFAPRSTCDKWTHAALMLFFRCLGFLCCKGGGKEKCEGGAQGE